MARTEPAGARGGERPNYHTHALTRGLVVLEVLAEGPQPMTLARIHERSGLPKPTLVRLLAALCEGDFLVRVDDQPTYRLGHKVLEVARAYLDVLDITQLAAPYMESLAESSRQTANLGVRDGSEVVHVAVGIPQRTLRFDAAVGDRASLHATSLGKMLLAALPVEDLDACLGPEPYPAHSPHTVTTRAALLEELAAIRESGWSLDDNEHAEGLTCLAVALEFDGVTYGALSVSGPSGEMLPERREAIVAMLLESAGAMLADAELRAALSHLSGLAERAVRPDGAAPSGDGASPGSAGPAHGA